MSENNFAKTDTVNQNNLASFNVKNIIFIILFCLYLSLNYVKLWNSIIRDFLIYIRNMQITIGNLQLYTLYALGLIYDCLLIALVVGILKYFFRKLSLLYSIMIGTILYFLNPIIYFFISLFFSLGNNSFNNIIQIFGLSNQNTIILQAIAIITGSIIGYNIIVNSLVNNYYLEEEDKNLGYLYGIPKKIWFLITFSISPVLQLLIKHTIVNIHYIFNVRFNNIISFLWNKWPFILERFFILFIPWGISISLFSYGLNIIKNKEKENRILKIIFIFIIIPALIISIPLIRNRTFYF